MKLLSVSQNLSSNLHSKPSAVLELYSLNRLETHPLLLELLALSCNTRSAYEELTRLHSRREQLEQREKRGESNRARSATIIRKAQEARAAEGAFQACLRNTIPELLMVWNEDLKTNSVRLKEASFNKLHDKDGVNLDVLQETADMLDLMEN
jgi:hypothetical protein